MSNLTVHLDMDRVQSSVAAAIRPAVDGMLKDMDIQAAIQKALKAPTPAKTRAMYMYDMLGYGDREQNKETMIESMVRQSIHEMAEQWVKKALRDQASMLEDAFNKMMTRSPDKLVKAFVGAMQKGLKNDWNFALEVKATHSTAERDSDDD